MKANKNINMSESIIKFDYTRFRELFDITEFAVEHARSSNMLFHLMHLSALRPDGTEIFSCDRDRLVWLSAIISNAKPHEVMPFIKRRECLNQLLEEHFDNIGTEFVRRIEGGFAMHPAIYYATGKTEVILIVDDVHFDFEMFRGSISEWVKKHGD